MANESKSNVFKADNSKEAEKYFGAVFLSGSETESHLYPQKYGFSFETSQILWQIGAKGQPYFFILSLSEMFSDSRIHFTFATSASELTPFFHFDFSVSVNFKVLSVFLN